LSGVARIFLTVPFKSKILSARRHVPLAEGGEQMAMKTNTCGRATVKYVTGAFGN
jgi:hypothetical protein